MLISDEEWCPDWVPELSCHGEPLTAANDPRCPIDSALKESENGACGWREGTRCPPGQWCNGNICKTSGTIGWDIIQDYSWTTNPVECAELWADPNCPPNNDHPISTDGRCGPDHGNARCPHGEFCDTKSHCYNKGFNWDVTLVGRGKDAENFRNYSYTTNPGGDACFCPPNKHSNEVRRDQECGYSRPSEYMFIYKRCPKKQFCNSDYNCTDSMEDDKYYKEHYKNEDDWRTKSAKKTYENYSWTIRLDECATR